MPAEISRHISYDEAIRSQTASRLGIKNIPDARTLATMKITAARTFEHMRDMLSAKRKKDSPIHISSFFRSPELNRAIGGSPTSSHCLGEAIDLDVDGMYSDFTNKNLFDLARQLLQFDQIIWEFGTAQNPAWVHVSYREGNNRKQILKALKTAGKTQYLPFS